MKGTYRLCLLWAAVACSAIRAEAPNQEPVLTSPLSALGQAEQRECEAFGETYLRLTELRDAGADKAVAVNRGVEFLSGLGRTGSHDRGKNYKPAVTQFADFVYGNKKLMRGTLYLYGLSSCAISKKARDDASFDRAMDLLDANTGRCQKQYPDHGQVKQLGSCVLAPVNGLLQQWASAAPK